MEKVNKSRKECVDHLGNKFDSITEMCKYWNITTGMYKSRKKLGWDIKTILTTEKQTLFKDHLDNTFQSLSAMLEYWHIPRGVYYRRKEKGWNLKDILTKNPEWTDHEGNVFESKGKMCEHWNIDRDTVTRRLRKGWTIESTLTTPLQEIYKKDKMSVDHLGNKFKSKKGMCEHWNVPVKTFTNRIQDGWELEKALTTPIVPHFKKIIDHLGNVYKSYKELYTRWNIEKDVFHARLKAGWTMEEILTKGNQVGIKCKDHKGNEFNSEKEMYTFWGISKATYLTKKQQGKTIGDMVAEGSLRGKKCKDHLGNEFGSVSEMCRHWNVSLNSFNRSNGENLPIYVCLGIVPYLYKNKKAEKTILGNILVTKYDYKGTDNKEYYMCTKDNVTYFVMDELSLYEYAWNYMKEAA